MSTYACSDFHGLLDLYKQVKAFLKPEDKVFFLGDAGDRGPQPWETIKAIAKDSQFEYLKGNHEQMLCDAYKEYDRHGRYGDDCFCLFHNGGHKTLDDLEIEEMPNGWVDYLNKLPTYTCYMNKQGQIIYLSHAGFTPFFKDDTNTEIKIPNNERLIWDREHFYDDWNENDCANVIIIHGHTPIPLMLDKINAPRDMVIEPGAYWYDNDHKVNIDCGAVWTGSSVLLDLDTWDEHIFFTKS